MKNELILDTHSRMDVCHLVARMTKIIQRVIPKEPATIIEMEETLVPSKSNKNLELSSVAFSLLDNNYTIEPCHYEMCDGYGQNKVSMWIVGKAKYYPGTYHDPPETDWLDIASGPNIMECLGKVLKDYFNDVIENTLCDEDMELNYLEETH